jgi:mannose-1-phosphate guanylyltransferase
MIHIVIMAGGAGTRFWPESRLARPKQLLPLAGPRSMLQMTVDRLGDLASRENVWILTAEKLVDAVAEQLPGVSRSHLIGEPCKRDTAPAIGLAALLLSRVDPQATMVLLAADHVIQPAEKFQQAIRAAADLVDKSPSRIVTFGIKPTYAATTFGYIERGEALASQESGGRSREPGDGDSASPLHPFSRSPVQQQHAYRVAQFREKPPAAVADQYVASGKFYWNSGMFIWRASTIVDALEKHQPEMMGHLRAIADSQNQSNAAEVFTREFAAIRGISIDYAVMEHATDVAVIEAPFTWDDVGTWQAAARLAGADADGNSVSGKHVGIDTRGSIVRTSDDHLVATVGVKDLIVVHTPDATLVANRHDEESIRRIVKLLEERRWTEYL